MAVSEQLILEALAGIKRPNGEPVGVEKMVRALKIEGSDVSFILDVPNSHGAVAPHLQKFSEEAVMALSDVEKVQILVTAERASAEPPSLKVGQHAKPQKTPLPIAGVKYIVPIGSGKGGVGKSTVSANIAVQFAKMGYRVGLLDADIYGPSQPKMMGVSERPKSPDGKMIIPLHAYGVTVMSIGLMLKEDEAVVWRGPMLMGALQQMLQQVEWGELDVLFIDLPPGTGDVQLSLAQTTEVKGAVVVSTPQDIALLDVRKAIDMFKKTKIPVLGMVENMSQYICDNCGHEAHIFGHGGAKAEADRLGVPFLGSIPLTLAARVASDSGEPVAIMDPKDAAALAIVKIAKNLSEILFP